MLEESLSVTSESEADRTRSTFEDSEAYAFKTWCRYVLNAVSTSDRTTRISYLTSQMSDFRTRLSSKSYSKTLPVGVADAGSVITATYAQGADYIMANIHPWFGGVPIDEAAGWTWEYFQGNTVSVSEAVSVSHILLLSIGVRSSYGSLSCWTERNRKNKGKSS